jgi:hypothetical protein
MGYILFFVYLLFTSLLEFESFKNDKKLGIEEDGSACRIKYAIRIL